MYKFFFFIVYVYQKSKGDSSIMHSSSVKLKSVKFFHHIFLIFVRVLARDKEVGNMDIIGERTKITYLSWFLL